LLRELPNKKRQQTDSLTLKKQQPLLLLQKANMIGFLYTKLVRPLLFLKHMMMGQEPSGLLDSRPKVHKLHHNSDADHTASGCCKSAALPCGGWTCPVLDLNFDAPQHIRFVGAGLSRTGTQSMGHYMHFREHASVYNQVAAISNNDMDLIRKTVPCRDFKDPSFQMLYARILDTATTSSRNLVTLDVPMNFCYRQIAMHQQRMGITNQTILLTRRDGYSWVMSMQKLLSAFAPIAGIPFTWMLGDMASHTAAQFAAHLNCTIGQRTVLGFSIGAYFVDPVQCFKGYVKWNHDVRVFAEQHGIPLIDIDIEDMDTLNIAHRSIRSVELSVIYVVTRIPVLVFLSVLVWLVYALTKNTNK
jgi:hypothetical protein